MKYQRNLGQTKRAVKNEIDPTCLVHGKKMSEHECLYCCLCFNPLTPEECNVLDDGSKEDVCKKCADEEKELLKRLKKK